MDYEVAICIPRLDDQIQRNTIEAIVDAAAVPNKTNEFHFHILTTYSDVKKMGHDDSLEGEVAIFSLIDRISIDALIVFPERFYVESQLQSIIDVAHKRKIPVISVGKILPDIVSIGYGMGSCMKDIVSHIIEDHGCRYINFIAGQKAMADTDERLHMYRQTMEEHGLPVEEERIGFGEFWDYPTEVVMEKFYTSSLPFPEAIVCANDVMAITVIASLRQHGFKVPDDVLVTGFDGIDMERFHSPRLTTAALDYRTVAKTVIDYLEKMISGEELPMATTIGFARRFSESCGCICDDKDNSYQQFASLWKETSSDIGFNDAVIKLSSSLKLSGSLHSMFSSIIDFFNFIYTTQIRVCLCSDFVNGASYISSYNGKRFTDTMYSVIEKRDDNFTVACDNRPFPLVDITPDKKYGIKRKYHTILYPLHYNDIVYGYLASNTSLNHIALYQIRAMSMNLAFVLERIATYRHMEAINKRLEETYIYDSMTGLLSRNGYYTVSKKLIEPHLKEDKRIVIVSVDLDNLKDINDKFGHSCGDTAIKIIASTLKDFIGESGISARFGGDEFVGIRLFDGSADEYVQKFSEGFNKAIAETVDNMNLEYNVLASFGIVSLLTKTLPSLEEGIKSADVLMYAQKRAKKRVSRSSPY